MVILRIECLMTKEASAEMAFAADTILRGFVQSADPGGPVAHGFSEVRFKAVVTGAASAETRQSSPGHKP
jgi:hypothetical protein